MRLNVATVTGTHPNDRNDTNIPLNPSLIILHFITVKKKSLHACEVCWVLLQKSSHKVILYQYQAVVFCFYLKKPRKI